MEPINCSWYRHSIFITYENPGVQALRPHTSMNTVSRGASRMLCNCLCGHLPRTPSALLCVVRPDISPPTPDPRLGSRSTRQAHHTPQLASPRTTPSLNFREILSIASWSQPLLKFSHTDGMEHRRSPRRRSSGFSSSLNREARTAWPPPHRLIKEEEPVDCFSSVTNSARSRGCSTLSTTIKARARGL